MQEAYICDNSEIKCLKTFPLFSDTEHKCWKQKYIYDFYLQSCISIKLWATNVCFVSLFLNQQSQLPIYLKKALTLWTITYNTNKFIN